MIKRFFTIFVFILALQNTCFASNDLAFLYINGSNNNDVKMQNWFLKGVKKFHPVLKKQIEKDPYTQQYMLNEGQYIIEKEPTIFFWGNKSHDDLMFMKEKANSLRSISPVIAFFVRITIADMLHDAIWVQKTHNMIYIIQDLDKLVKAQTSENKKVVLFGYSAGTFITMEYLLNKMPYIDLSTIFDNSNLDTELTNLVKNNPRKDTCLMAFVASNLTNASPMGKIIVNKNKQEFKTAFNNIDKFTDKYCAPEDSVIGVVNYASPIPLFYSDMADKNMDTSKYTYMMYKYLIEHDFFFLTVNYADDPLGFPNGINLTNDEIKNKMNLEFDNELGFFYDYSKALSWRTFAGAHTSYWKTSKRFSKAIVKGYTEGRKFQYDDDFQAKMLKRSEKRTKLK